MSFKRRHKPFEIDGETYYARSMTLRQVQENQKVGPDEEKLATVLRTLADCLTDAEGNQSYANSDDPALLEMPMDKLAEFTAALANLSRPGNLAKIEKNSDATP